MPNYIGYYVGQIRKESYNPKSEFLYANQQKFFAYLQSVIPDIKIVRGHIQNYNGLYREKGVDVRLALDIYRLANDDVYDKAILISSDSDLVPAIRMVQERYHKVIEYVGFFQNSSIALIKECKRNRLLNKRDIYRFEFSSRKDVVNSSAGLNMIKPQSRF